LCPMDVPAMALLRRLERLLGYGGVALGFAALSLALLQGVLARQLARNRLQQRAAEVAFTARLAALALETLPPVGLAQLSGLTLRLQPPPQAPPLPEQAELARLLCRRLSPCPQLLPAAEPRGLWLALDAPLDRVWLLVPLPLPAPWPPPPWLLAVALLLGGGATTVLYLSLEVEQPLRRLQQAQHLAVLPRGRGTPAVQALRLRLQQAEAERSVMLAGLAHDLRAPLTRLRLRHNLEVADGAALAAGVAADLDELERLVDQFLVFAAGEQAEAPVLLPLDQWLAELAAAYPPELQLQLTPLERAVRPTGLARAVANLLDNALSHGRPPLLLRLLPWGAGAQGFAIEVWDGGEGIDPQAWPRALEPFERLDAARSRGGHSGLGLPIALRAAQAHGGGLALLHHPPEALQRLGLCTGVALQCGSERSGHTSASRRLWFRQI